MKRKKKTFYSPYDPLGCYTGKVLDDIDEKPVQDADDL